MRLLYMIIFGFHFLISNAQIMRAHAVYGSVLKNYDFKYNADLIENTTLNFGYSYLVSKVNSGHGFSVGIIKNKFSRVWNKDTTDVYGNFMELRYNRHLFLKKFDFSFGIAGLVSSMAGYAHEH